jgi:RNA polymerase-binding transcription factor DksA
VVLLFLENDSIDILLFLSYYIDALIWVRSQFSGFTNKEKHMKLKARKSAFDATFLKRQKCLLEATIKESFRGCGVAKVNLEVTTEVIGVDDEPNITHDQALAIHNLNGNREVIAAVNLALASINRNDGTYGICQECEEPIRQKRLEAVPWAKYCIKCQESSDLDNLNIVKSSGSHSGLLSSMSTAPEDLRSAASPQTWKHAQVTRASYR